MLRACYVPNVFCRQTQRLVSCLGTVDQKGLVYSERTTGEDNFKGKTCTKLFHANEP